jgi:nitrogen fixation protein NifU and related proteins
MHCSVLAEEGIHKAINDYRTRHNLTPWEEKAHEHHDEKEDCGCSTCNTG